MSIICMETSNRRMRRSLLSLAGIVFAAVCFGQPPTEIERSLSRFHRLAMALQSENEMLRQQLNAAYEKAASHEAEIDSIRKSLQWDVQDLERRNQQLYARYQMKVLELGAVMKERDSLLSELIQTRELLERTRVSLDSTASVSIAFRDTLAQVREALETTHKKLVRTQVEGVRQSLYFCVLAPKRVGLPLTGDFQEYMAHLDSGRFVHLRDLRRARHRISFRVANIDPHMEFNLRYQVVRVDDPTTGSTDKVFEFADNARVIAGRDEDYNLILLDGMKLLRSRKYKKGEYMLKYELLEMTGIGPEVPSYGIERLRFVVD